MQIHPTYSCIIDGWSKGSTSLISICNVRFTLRNVEERQVKNNNFYVSQKSNVFDKYNTMRLLNFTVRRQLHALFDVHLFPSNPLPLPAFQQNILLLLFKKRKN